MDNKSYVKAVNEGRFPQEIEVPLDAPFIDNRGEILNVWLGSCGSITYITTKKGAARANHTHKEDWHSCFIIEGELTYLEGEGDKQVILEFKSGDQFFTKPEVYHKLIFKTDCKMMTFNGIIKNHENYEASVIRKK